jgi:hypothetical protein
VKMGDRVLEIIGAETDEEALLGYDGE